MAEGRFPSLNELIASSAEADDYKCKNDTLIFKAYKFFGIVGFVGMLFVMGIVVVAITDSSQLGAKLFLIFFFSLPGVPLVLLYLVARVYLDEDKLVYRNPIGIKRTILWKDVTEIYSSPRNNGIVVCTGKRKLKLGDHFKGCYVIEEVIKEKCWSTFNEVSYEKSGYQHFIREDGSVVLKGRKLYAVIGGAMLLVAVGCLFLPVEGPPSAKALLVALFAIPGILVLLCSFTLRLSMDTEKIAYRNLIGITRAIRWQDLKSVRSEAIGRKACTIFTGKNGQKIRLSPGYLDGYDHIGKFVRQFNPKKKRKRKA